MPNPNRLDGRVAVVTGASSGIGAATAQRLAADGAHVALLARRADRLQALAADIGPNATAVPLDVTDPAALDAAAAAIGPADLVVANAGVMLPGPFPEARRDEWQRMLSLNVLGVLDTARAFLPGLLDAAAAGRRADLVIVSSIGARQQFPDYAVYCATKAAVSALAANLRVELGGRGLRVTNLEPGLIESELADNVVHDEARAALARWRVDTPPLQSMDVADAIADVVGRPAHVHVRELIVQPTVQA